MSAAFAFIPNSVKPCVASKLAEIDRPVVCPPQWLPVLLASREGVLRAGLAASTACSTKHYILSSTDSELGASSTQMAPLLVTLDGSQTGYPVQDGSSCDEVAAFSVESTKSDGTLVAARAISTRLQPRHLH